MAQRQSADVNALLLSDHTISPIREWDDVSATSSLPPTSGSRGARSSSRVASAAAPADMAVILSSKWSAPATDQVKPKLQVSASGKFEDQFFHAQDASRAMGLLKNRTYTQDATKRKKSGLPSKDNAEQFSEADVVHSGTLVKQGSFWKSWHKRYFILRRDVPVLAYYESQSQLTKLGEIAIDATTTVGRVQTALFPLQFLVQHGNRKLVLLADSAQTLEVWMQQISHCIMWRHDHPHESVPTNRSGHSNSTSNSGGDQANGDGVPTEAMVAAHRRTLTLARRNSPNVTSDAMKRCATDSIPIQIAAQEAQAQRLGDTERLSMLRNSRLESKESLPPTTRRFRSFSAGSVLTHAPDGTNITATMAPPPSAPQLQKFQSMAKASPNLEKKSRSRCMSLTQFKAGPSMKFVVSVASKGPQTISHMVVVVKVDQSSPYETSRTDMKELSRTDMQGALSLRAYGGDIYTRDFHSLLTVPVGVKKPLRFEIYSIVNTNTDVLDDQFMVGYFQIHPIFVEDATSIWPCRMSKGVTQELYLVLNKIFPHETINLGHTFTYANHHFIAETVPVERQQTTVPAAAPTSDAAALQRPGTADDVWGKLESALDSNHVFISEELSASYCSVSVVAAYLAMMRDRNSARIHEIKVRMKSMDSKYAKPPSSPGTATEAANRDRTDFVQAEISLDNFVKANAELNTSISTYNALIRELESSRKNPDIPITACVKRSTSKKDKNFQFMPTNLNTHVVRAKRVQLSIDDPLHGIVTVGKDSNSGITADEVVHAVVTHGCPAAHTLGFKEGGLRRLRATAKNMINEAAFLEEVIEIREDVVRSQILTVAAASFLTILGLSSSKSALHKEQLKLLCATGFLVSMESLLSTLGNEKGMLEDVSDGIKWLNDCVYFSVVQSKNTSRRFAMCESVKREHSMVTATFAVPADLFSMLPPNLSKGDHIKVRAVLFSQGINEMQSVANTVMDASLQEEINKESAKVLHNHFQIYMNEVERMKGELTKGRVEEVTPLLHRVTELLVSCTRKASTQKKNVNILIESSDICRRIGAGRTTCCKSGKDRTAMSVTLECSRLLVDAFHVRQGIQLCASMRECGVRRDNVFINTGQFKFAFNSLQLKCLPDCYKPPTSTADAHAAS